MRGTSIASACRCSSRRPVRWPSTSTQRHSIARSTRSVSCAGSWAKWEWMEATTTSSWARQSSARSSDPSARMSHSMPASSVSPSKRPFSVAHAGGVFERPPLVEAVGHRQRLRVVGDRDVLVAAPVRLGRHRLQRVAAVGGGGVHVQVAAEVGRRDQLRQAARLGRVDLALVLAQLRGNPRQAERVVDVLLGGARPPPGRRRAASARTRSASCRAAVRGPAARCCGPWSR